MAIQLMEDDQRILIERLSHTLTSNGANAHIITANNIPDGVTLLYRNENENFDRVAVEGQDIFIGFDNRLGYDIDFFVSPDADFNGSISDLSFQRFKPGSVSSPNPKIFSFDFEVSPVEDSPTDITLSNNTVDEEDPGVLVGALSTVDPDAGDLHSHTLIEDISGKFEINGSLLWLKAGEELDFEDVSSHSIVVRTTDLTGRAIERTLTINVEDVNDGNRVGTSQADVLTGDAFGNLIQGGEGDDELFGLAGEDTLDGGEGADFMDGGAGNDSYIIDNAGDILRDTGGGFDRATTSIEGYALFRTGVEALQLASGTSFAIGSGLNNVMSGNVDDNVLRGVGGNDLLSGGQGRDTLFGGVGDDIIRGGRGADSLIGDAGLDTFEYTFVSDSGVGSGNRDAIQEFSIADNDRIDLSALDAIEGGGDDAFSYIGSAAFSATMGELRYDTSSGVGLLQADINGDGVTDFEIALVGSPLLEVGDIIL